MNLVLVSENDFVKSKKRIRLDDRRHKHILNVHNAKIDDTLGIGYINGKIGTGIVTCINNEFLEMDVTFDSVPPIPLQLTLILSLPRPKVLNRILSGISSLGVKNIYLVNSWRVEKSYWQSPVLNKNNIYKQLLLGLEQSKDTIIPEIHLKKLFKPFVEDELPEIIKNTTPILAHPKTETICPGNLNQDISLAIGPEGGFIPYEVKKLEECGFKPFHFGERVLKVEIFIPFAISRLFSF